MDILFGKDVKRVNRKFHCPALGPSPTVPISVHSLRPADIRVIAAIGDSLTAGRGAKGGVFGLLMDYRGLSWSGGGDDDYSQTLTLPNVFRQYNPSLYGYSKGTGSSRKKFNVAVTGAESKDILSQAKDLVSRLKSDENVDYANDWKLITIFIGANDLCNWCENPSEYSAETYKGNIQTTLDYLKQQVPRAFVNLVEILNVEFVQQLGANMICDAVQAFVCDCIVNPSGPDAEAKLIKLREAYQAAARDIVNSRRYDTTDDFTVVLQPFFRNTTLPKKPNSEPDLSYFASDCFHLSKKGQEAAAEALWNNLVEPVGSKRTSWTPGELIECPTEAAPYLYTAKNSNVTTRGKPARNYRFR